MSRVRLLIIGGSDAGISAGPAARDHDPTAEVTLFLAEIEQYALAVAHDQRFREAGTKWK